MIDEASASYAGVGTRELSVAGDGIPIVLLHGYADNADTWRGVLVELERAGRRALAVDLPGFGHADARTVGPMVPQFDAFVDGVIAAHGTVVLVGNSLGATTAVHAAARHPEAVIGLAALDDPMNARHLLARVARTADIPAALWWCAGQIRVPSAGLRWLTERGLRRALYGLAAADPDVIARWVETYSSAAELADLCKHAFGYARETRTGHRGVRVGCPTAVVHGAADRIIPVHASYFLHQQIPHSDLVALPDSGHCPQLDSPAKVAELIARLPGSATSGKKQTG
jgi:pimeloyl-ACP methyl ester carboxylesterase